MSDKPAKPSATPKTLGARPIYTESSYTRTLRTLLRSQFRIPASVPDNDPDLNMITKITAETAQIRKQATGDNHRIQETSSRIADALARLGESKSNAQHRQVYMQKFSPLQTDAQKIQNERTVFNDDVAKFVTHQNESLQAAINKHLAGNATPDARTSLKSTLMNIEKEKRELKRHAERLGIDESTLQQQLDQLDTDTQAITAITGTSMDRPQSGQTGQS